MTKTCPSCDVLAPSDARYCRHCGAPLKRLGADDGVSPIATTVPLSGHNPTDEIISQPAEFTNASHTSEVSREEMRDLLGRGTTAAADERRNGETHRTGDAQRESGASSARPDAPHNYAQDDFDPE